MDQLSNPAAVGDALAARSLAIYSAFTETLEDTISLSGSSVTLSDAYVGEDKYWVLELENTEGVSASGLSGMALPSDEITYRGGSFPGTGGTCGNTLAAGSTCTLSLSFRPTQDGSRAFEFVWPYTVAGVSSSISYQINTPLLSGTSFTLDTETFGSGNGFIKTKVEPASELLVASTLQSDGKIVSTGCYYPVGSTTGFDVSVVRYLPNGTLDSSFGTNGVTTTGVGTGVDDCGAMPRMTSDGKIVVVGYAKFGSFTQAVVLRYTSSGALDTTFATGGVYAADVGAGSESLSDFRITDDSIVAVGTTNNGTQNDLLIIKLSLDGVPDSSFGTGGIKVVDMTGGYDAFARIAKWNSNGTFVAVGTASNGSNNDLFIARFEADGDLDTSFGSSGGYTLIDYGGADSMVDGIELANGKFVLASIPFISGFYQVGLARTDSSGVLDTTFGTSGLVSTYVSTATNSVGGVVEAADGKLVVSASAGNNFAVDKTLVLYRFTSAGALDTAVNGTGYELTQIMNGASVAGRQSPRQILKQPDGKYVFTSYFHDGGNEAMLVLRYWP